MVFGWWRERRRRRFLAEVAPSDWVPHLDALPFVHSLEETRVRRLVGLARGFESETEFEGCGGLELSEAIVRNIALQACRLILGLDQDHYRKVRTVLVYPGAFQAKLSEDRQIAASGLAVPDGPVILAWDYVLGGGRNAGDGRNVVYHEFAHKLDMLDGYTDGTPPLGVRSHRETWERIMTRELQALRKASRSPGKTLVHPYGGTDPAEFFAESTEVFFERSRDLRRKHASLYRELATFYRQDPAAGA